MANFWQKLWNWVSGESNRQKLFKDPSNPTPVIQNIYDDVVGNSQIDKTLNAQQTENQLNRDHNLGLAKLQNKLNIEQWQRENQYNAPTAQAARLAAAGLNADMMYGQGGISNISAASPGMTSGAPSSPMDWSSLANKKSVADTLNYAKGLEALDAQISESKARARKTLAEAGLSEISLEYEDAMKKLGLKMTETEFEKSKVDLEAAKQAVDLNMETLAGIRLDNARKAIENFYADERHRNTNRKLAADLKITEAQAEHAQQYFAAQLLGLQADNAWKDAAWIVQQKEGVATLIKYGSESIGDLLGNLLSWVKPKGAGKGQKMFKNMKQDGNVLTWE